MLEASFESLPDAYDSSKWFLGNIDPNHTRQRNPIQYQDIIPSHHSPYLPRPLQYLKDLIWIPYFLRFIIESEVISNI
jgi:hypothetical protein